MTFLGLRSTDLIGIASTERARRAAAMREMPRVTVAQRRTDAAEWAAIVEWLRWALAGSQRGRMPAGEGGLVEADHLYGVITDITGAALRDWFANGRPSGEPEARAFLLYALARAFARLTGAPAPSIDYAAGLLVVPDFIPSTGARIVGDLTLYVLEIAA